jgi:hypothetical protein
MRRGWSDADLKKVARREGVHIAVIAVPAPYPQ